MEEVKEVIPVKPEKCAHSGQELEGEDLHPLPNQVTEIPPLVAETVEYQLHTLECPECGTRTQAELPEGREAGGAFGPRVQAMVAALSGPYHLSKRQIEELLEDFFGVELGLGRVWALEEATSEVLKEPVEEVQEAVKEQPVANVEETGWREGTKRGWLWVAVTAAATVFLIRLRGCLKSSTKIAPLLAKEGLGEVQGGLGRRIDPPPSPLRKGGSQVPPYEESFFKHPLRASFLKEGSIDSHAGIAQRPYR